MRVKLGKIFLPISLSIMFWVLKKTVSLRRLFEYPQHMFWLRNKKNIFLFHPEHGIMDALSILRFQEIIFQNSTI